MNFKELVITTLSEEDTVIVEDAMLEEGFIFPISPFLAYAAFKKKVFNTFNKENKFKDIPDKKIDTAKEKVKEVQSKGLVAKEKLRAKMGLKSGAGEGATIYRLTKEQTDVMADILNKYGTDIVKEINSFRVNVLAPYQLIKRIVKKSKSVTSVDVTGMTKDEFRANLESGRKKILKSGSFFESSRELENKIRDLETEINNLEKEKEKLISGKDLSSSILEKVYASFKVGEKDFGKYSLVDLKVAHDEYIKNLKLLKSYNKENKKNLSTEDVLNLIKRQNEVRTQEPKKEENGKEEEKKETVAEQPMSFSLAFGKYMLRRNIRDSFKKETGSDIYKKAYTDIVDGMISSMKERKTEMMKYYIDYKKKVDLTPKEKLIWVKRPGSTTNYTGNIDDYIQAIKEEDFKEPEYIERPKELQEAEQEIENEIKRFERKLATIIEPEDLKKLKKYRLINNLITVGELKDPASLFRTAEEYRELQTKKIAATHFVDEEEFMAKVKQVTSTPFETKEELDRAKTELRALAQTLRRQNDQLIIDKNAEAFRVALSRKNLEGKPEPKQEEPEEKKEEVTLDSIKQIGNSILNKTYSSKEDIDADEKRFNDAVEEFKKTDTEDKLSAYEEERKKVIKKIEFAKDIV